MVYAEIILIDRPINKAINLRILEVTTYKFSKDFPN